MKDTFGVPIITDIHEAHQAEAVAQVRWLAVTVRWFALTANAVSVPMSTAIHDPHQVHSGFMMLWGCLAAGLLLDSLGLWAGLAS